MRVFACAAALWLVMGASAQARPFTVEEALHMQDLGDVAVAPGGRWVIIEKGRPYDEAPRYDNDTNPGPVLDQLWAADLAQGGPAQLLFPQDKGVGYQAGPISPSGTRMLVYRLAGYRFDAGVVDLARHTVRWLGVTPELPSFGRSAVWRGDDQIILIENPPGLLPYVLRSASANMQTLPELWRPTIRGTGVSLRVLGSGRYLQDHPRPEPRHLLSIDLRSGDRYVLTQGDFIDLELSPSGRRLAVLGEAETLADPPDRPIRIIDSTRRTDLTVVDLESGEIRHPCPELDLARSLLAWSPAGDRVLVLGRKPSDDWPAAQLLEVVGSGATATPLEGGVTPVLNFTPYLNLPIVHADWLGDAPVVYARPTAAQAARPDWFRLSNTTAEPITHKLSTPPAELAAVDAKGDLMVADGKLWRMDLDGRLSRAASLPGAQIRRAREPSAGLRVSAFTAPRGHCVEVQSARGEETEFARACRSGHVVQEGYIRSSDQPVGPAQGDAFISIEGDAHGVRTVAARTRRTTRPLLQVNADLQAVDFAEVKQIHHIGPAGEPLTSWLYLPRDRKPGARFALVVMPYPGAAEAVEPYQGRPGVAFVGTTPQLVAGQGYAVLVPSLPRSGNEPAAGLADQLLAVLEATVAQAPVDLNRMAIWGHSFGGYASLAIATQTGRFKAVIAEAGDVDLAAHYGSIAPPYRTDPELTSYRLQVNMGWSETGQGGLKAAPWQAPQRYVRNSPLFAADRIATPVMLIQGDQDVVDVSNGEKMFNALYRQAKDAILLTYWGEGHTISSPPNVRDKYSRAFAFLRTYLGAP